MLSNNQVSTAVYLLPRAMIALYIAWSVLAFTFVPARVGTLRIYWLIATGAVVVTSAVHWFRRGSSEMVAATRADHRRLEIDMAVMSVLYWVLHTAARPYFTRVDDEVMGLAAMGFIACGLMLMALVRSAALVFLVVNSLGIALQAYGDTAVVVVARLALLLIWSLSMWMAISFVASSLESRFFAELDAATERQTVALLLDDFEDGAPDWLWETDVNDRFTRVATRFAEVTQRSAHQLTKLSLAELLSQLQPSSVSEGASGARRIAEMINRREPFRAVEVAVSIGGETRWWTLSGKPRPEEPGWRGVASDITQTKVQSDKIARLATIDELTGLANRHQFGEALADAVARVSPAEVLTVGILDLDNFKSINDTLGHPIGDELLAAVGERLYGWAKLGTFCARIGGDEFAILIRTPTRESGALALKECLALFELPFAIDGVLLDAHASIGAAIYPNDARSADDLMRRADLALFAAKDLGRGRIRHFTEALAQSSQARALALQEIGTALQNNAFELHYQPQIHVGSDTVVALEALARWRHPTRGLLYPDSFIQVAEETGLIVPIGRLVLQSACIEASRWPSELRVGVNISHVQLRSSTAVSDVVYALERANLAADRLEIEVTESVLADDLSIQTLKEIKGLGVQVAIDDFGTGYSSLSILQTFPVDRIKIDRAFVSTLDSARSRALFSSVVQVAQALELDTTAEGVETTEQLDVVRRSGCAHFQGYLESRPIPADRLPEYFSQRIGR